MAYCTRCGKETDWTSKSGYCKKCASEMLNVVNGSRCDICGELKPGVTNKSLSDGSERFMCADCYATICGSRDFIAYGNVKNLCYYTTILNYIFASDAEPGIKNSIMNHIGMNEERYYTEVRNRNCVPIIQNEGFWEYMTVSVSDRPSGGPDSLEIQNVLNFYGKMGWKLKTAFTNEMGKRASAVSVGGMTMGTNSTLDTTVMVLERFVQGSCTK